MNKFLTTSLLTVAAGVANASAAVITPEQQTALTDSMSSGISEYVTVLFGVAAVVIPAGIVIGLLWRFVPTIKTNVR